MAPLTIIPGDDHYVGVTAIITVLMQLLFFAIAWTFQFDKVTDFAGSTNFILIVLLPLCAGGVYSSRGILAVSLVVVSRAELAAFLLYRVLRRGKDDRFDAIRGNLGAFLFFWVFQMVWAYGVSLPVIFTAADPAPSLTNPTTTSASTGLEARDWAGLAMWAVGFLTQVAADLQKDAFRADPANKGRVCDAGVWRYSRHPNFFGEILLWWGIFTVCAPQFEASYAAAVADPPLPGAATWGYAGILSPLLTMLILLKVSGMPTAEGDYQKRFMRTREGKAAFLAYRAKTSPLIPLPHSLYSALPLWVKRVALFEWPSYETDWSYCGEDEGGSSSGGGEAAAGRPGGSSGSAGGQRAKEAAGASAKATPASPLLEGVKAP